MACVESVVELLLKKLTDPLIREAFFSNGVGDNVEWLVAEFRQMRPFLKYADVVEQEGDERVKKWVGEVRDVAFDAEDVIDTFVLQISTLRRRGFVGSIRRYAFFFNKSIGRHDVGSEMERINNKIRLISERMSTCGIQNIDQGAGTSSASLGLEQQRIRTFPLIRDPDFVGFEGDLERLVARLTEGGLRRSVVSIVGRAGIGKTALAKEVYNDSRVKNHFECRAWISLSRQYGLRHPLEKIVEQLMEEKITEMKATEFYMDKISEYLKTKRYLIVLDYVCTKQTWDAVKGAFPDMDNGSRVMLTTRNIFVTLYADENSWPHHQLELLNNENSLKLLCKKAFPGRDGSCPQDLEEFGRKIVEECNGLPLLIVIIGKYLSRKEQMEWEKSSKIITSFQESFKWQSVDEEIEISDVVCFSYKYLPYYLKSCILYLANFPKDHELHTKELIRLWVAEGLVEERGEETMEEVGEEYLKEFVERGIVKVAGTSSSGGIKSCRIDPFLWYFSILEAEECKFSQAYPFFVQNPASRARRLALTQGALSFSAPLLRSLLVYTPSDTHLTRSEEKLLYRRSKLLRVLHLHGFEIQNLPTEVGELIHLRYLRCTKTLLKSLPSSIANLPDLQTLHVTSTSDITIPGTILEMQQLRHLLVAGLFKVNYLGWMENWGVIQGHPRLERISNLQTLSQVKPGEWIQGCLGKLTNLRKLGIALDTVADAHVLYESIVKMDHLSSLSVVTLAHVNRTLGLLVPPLSHLLRLSKLRLEGKLDKLPESTEFPTNLTKLTLAYSCLNQDPMATLEKLRNLRILRLLGYSYVGVEMVCSARQFPQLEYLHLQGLFGLEEWRVEEGAMPKLLHLQISTCLNLKKFPEGLRHLNTLKTLGLRNMPDDFKKLLREYWGEGWQKSWHKPSIDISND